MSEMRKFFADVSLDPTLGERQIRVIANSGKSDRVKDVLVASGCKLDNYRTNNIVLADHDRSAPIGNFAPEIAGSAVAGVLTFAPKGISAKADEYCALYKAGVMKSVSVGFNPIDYEPNKAGGYDFKEWELLELSCVAVPCDPGAVVTARSLGTKADGAVWKVGASRNLPIGGDEAWDGPAAEASIFSHAGFDGDSPDYGFARKGFLAYDSANPKLKGSYKLPFAKVADGRLTAVPSGIRAAASRLPGTDISDECRTKARAVIDHYEAKMKPQGTDDDGKAGKALSQAHLDHVKAAQKCMAAMGDCHMKALDSRGETHDDLENFRRHLNEFGHHAKALADAMKPGSPISDDHVEHVKGLNKAHAAMTVIHASALDNSSETEDHLKAFKPPMDEMGAHLKALAKGGRKKPSPSDGDNSSDNSDDGDGADNDDPNDDDSDVELAAAAERRKRLIEIAAASAA